MTRLSPASRVFGRTGGGIALYVNERWCDPGHVTVKERFCSPDIELLAVGLRPFDLPRELYSVVVVAVYIPPCADAEVAGDVIHSSVAKLQTLHPNNNNNNNTFYF